MRKGIILFLLGCCFIFQLACTEVLTGLSDKAGCCAEAPSGLSAQKGCTWQPLQRRRILPLISKGAFMLGLCYAQEEKIDPYQWDFGKVKQGVVLKHDFILKNETNDILGINNIHTSCGCTASESAKKSLMPQENTAITVSFNSKGYSGAVTQFVYVHTDNADLGIIKFTIKAQVIKD